MPHSRLSHAAHGIAWVCSEYFRSSALRCTQTDTGLTAWLGPACTWLSLLLSDTLTSPSMAWKRTTSNGKVTSLLLASEGKPNYMPLRRQLNPVLGMPKNKLTAPSQDCTRSRRQLTLEAPFYVPLHNRNYLHFATRKNTTHLSIHLRHQQGPPLQQQSLQGLHARHTPMQSPGLAGSSHGQCRHTGESLLQAQTLLRNKCEDN